MDTEHDSDDMLKARKSRGAVSNPTPRLSSIAVAPVDDGWWSDEPEQSIATEVNVDHARRIIARNSSPDVNFNQSINPYRGCEHGCVYCFARPTHAWLDLSAGLDFETKLFFKKDAAGLLATELSHPRYVPEVIALGANTDPYQPIEREYRITRSILEVCEAFGQPVTIVTKGALIERDVDILARMAQRQLASVMLSVTTLDNDLKRVMEPRAAGPAARLRVLRALTEAGVPTGVLMAPVIPAINDDEIERLVTAVANAGAQTVRYVMLRLPHELKELFADWLTVHYPLRREKVLAQVRDMRGGALYDARWGVRQRGVGVYADLIAQRFRRAIAAAGLRDDHLATLALDAFRVPEPFRRKTVPSARSGSVIQQGTLF